MTLTCVFRACSTGTQGQFQGHLPRGLENAFGIGCEPAGVNLCRSNCRSLCVVPVCGEDLPEELLAALFKATVEKTKVNPKAWSVSFVEVRQELQGRQSPASVGVSVNRLTLDQEIGDVLIGNASQPGAGWLPRCVSHAANGWRPAVLCHHHDHSRWYLLSHACSLDSWRAEGIFIRSIECDMLVRGMFLGDLPYDIPLSTVNRLVSRDL